MPKLDSSKVVAQVQSLAGTKAGRTEILSAAAHAMREAGPPYTSVYFYMLEPSREHLVLEAHSGRNTPHTRIAVGVGVCGTAVATGTDQNVGDVRAVSNYLACNVYTRSELVVLIRKDGEIVGQVDIDSDEPDPFTIEEAAAVRAVADEIGRVL